LRAQPTERRISAARFLAETARAVITADAGAGKTTLLRYLALEILSEAPALRAVSDRYAGYVPVWVPFALWARMSEGKVRPRPLEEVVYGFIQALNEPELAKKMRRVLRTNKFVLLVDGLDETREQSIADALIVSLTVMAEQAGVSVFATSRPHGMKALSGIGGTWGRVRLAPLSEQQRGALALLWYRILERHELGATASATAVERQARNRAESFTRPCWQAPASRGLRKRRSFSFRCSSSIGSGATCHATGSTPARKSSNSLSTISPSGAPRTR
jgi:NACHT domain